MKAIDLSAAAQAAIDEVRRVREADEAEHRASQEPDATHEWLRLCYRAIRMLQPEQFAAWSFIIGTHGDDAERTKRGVVALDIVQGRWRPE